MSSLHKLGIKPPYIHFVKHKYGLTLSREWDSTPCLGGAYSYLVVNKHYRGGSGGVQCSPGKPIWTYATKRGGYVGLKIVPDIEVTKCDRLTDKGYFKNLYEGADTCQLVTGIGPQK